MCYSTDSTGHIHLSRKESHHASKAAVDYYNASFLDVSPSNSCYHIHWLSYTFTPFSWGRNSVNQEDGVICLSQYVTLSGQCGGVCLVWHIVFNVQCAAIWQKGTMLFCNLFTLECSLTHVHEVFNGWYCIHYLILCKGIFCSKGLHCCSVSNEPHQGWLLGACVAVPYTYHCAPEYLHGGEKGTVILHYTILHG